jgi:hypothetical protein
MPYLLSKSLAVRNAIMSAEIKNIKRLLRHINLFLNVYTSNSGENNCQFYKIY